jgi:acyl dehydratase
MTATALDSIDALKARAGTHLGYSEWREVTQEMINQFADATDDHQWIHVDVERAKTGPFGGPVAHGYLTLSLVVPLLQEVIDVQGTSLAVNYGCNRVRFPAPVPVGSHVRLGASLKQVEDVSGGVQAVIEATIELEGGSKPACVAETLYRYYR